MRNAAGPLHHDPHGGCWTCTHFGRRWERSNVLCLQGPAPHVQAAPDGGCAFWQREPGADDELHFDRPPPVHETPFRPESTSRRDLQCSQRKGTIETATRMTTTTPARTNQRDVRC